MELEKINGCNVKHQYITTEKDKIWSAMLKGLTGDEPIKKCYYEVVDKKGRTKFISENKTLVLSVAGRFGHDWREVDYEESWEEIEAGTEE